MTRRTFDELVEDARALTPAEQLRLRAMLDEWISSVSEREREAELARGFLERGAIRRIPPPIMDLTPYRDRKPIEIEGEPLSETIIRERR